MSGQCPFLSTVEEKVSCFNECVFHEHEGSGDGCPFKRIKGNKSLSIKEILSFDLDSKEEDGFNSSEDFEGPDDFNKRKEFLDSMFIKDYL
jgi:hypothetical protein